MQLGRNLRVLDHAAGESESGGVEQAPGVALIKLLECWCFPFGQYLRYALDVDYPLPKHVEYGVVGLLVGEQGALVPLEGAVLLLAMQGQGFDQLAH